MVGCRRWNWAQTRISEAIAGDHALHRNGQTEALHTPTEKMIHETEAWLNFEAWRIICCSYYMISHVSSIFGLPNDKLDMIPNGININTYDSIKDDLTDFRAKFALPEEKIILMLKISLRKGIHILINAVPKVLSKANAKFIIVGSGYMKEQLLGIVRGMGVEHKVLFQGTWTSNLCLGKKCADVSVVPSLLNHLE